MLYWAEGSKGRNTVALSNSDPEVLRFFVSFLRAYFRIPNTRVRVTCNLFADHVERQREVEQFWLDMLELSRSCMTKSTVNVYSKYSQRMRKNRLPFGTCRVCGTTPRSSRASSGQFRNMRASSARSGCVEVQCER